MLQDDDSTKSSEPNSPLTGIHPQMGHLFHTTSEEAAELCIVSDVSDRSDKSDRASCLHFKRTVDPNLSDGLLRFRIHCIASAVDQEKEFLIILHAPRAQ